MKLRTEGLSWREVDGETVMLDLKSSTYLRANRTGTLLVKALAEGCERQDLVDTLSEAFGLSPEQAAHDVDAFVAELAEKGFLAND